MVCNCFDNHLWHRAPRLAVAGVCARYDRWPVLQQMSLCEAIREPAAPEGVTVAFGSIYSHVIFLPFCVRKNIYMKNTKTESSKRVCVERRVTDVVCADG